VTEHEQTLRAFMGEWGKSFAAITAAYRKYLAPDAVWEQQPFPTTRTVEEAIGLLEQFRKQAGLETFPAEIRHLAVSGDLAFVERTDHLRRADGSPIISAAVTGVFEFNGSGQIAAWREYFDSSTVIKAIEAASRKSS
jgi:limonene-1,2-epoxide hydrolase